MHVRADEILKMLDPIIGVAGKEADVTFNLSSGVIEASITNPSESALCRMSVDVGEGLRTGSFDRYGVAEDTSVTVDIDALVGALKWFGTHSVDMFISELNLVIEQLGFGRRTIRMRETAVTSRSVKFKSSLEVSADPVTLKRLTGLDGISDNMVFELQKGTLHIGCMSDSGTAEIYLDTGIYHEHRSIYSSELVVDIVKRIHCDKGDEVTISLSEDAPLGFAFSFGCASYMVFVAPRIETV